MVKLSCRYLKYSNTVNDRSCPLGAYLKAEILGWTLMEKMSKWNLLFIYFLFICFFYLFIFLLKLYLPLVNKISFANKFQPNNKII